MPRGAAPPDMCVTMFTPSDQPICAMRPVKSAESSSPVGADSSHISYPRPACRGSANQCAWFAMREKEKFTHVRRHLPVHLPDDAPQAPGLGR
ncbi:hypothetical protein AERO9AM_70635 [Aeromicrobium sp. 9AM]|nr:hypothetical protein AERO9AM_70635 [Aeromicrobium sp. 9AM]